MSSIQEHFLTFIHLSHPTSFPIYRYYTTTHNFITDICYPFPPRLPCPFNISAATPDGPVALPLFALNIANLTSSADITLPSTAASTLFNSSILSLFQLNFSNQLILQLTTTNQLINQKEFFECQVHSRIP